MNTFDEKSTSNIRWVAFLYVILVLFLPNAIRDVSTIYHVDASAYVGIDTFTGMKPWLDYSLSVVEILAILGGLFIRPRIGQINLRPLLLFLLIYNLLRFLCGFSNIIYYNDFSLILSLLEGYGCYLILTKDKIKFDLEFLIDSIIIFNFLTQIMFVLTGRQIESGGRYAALGSGPGAVGTMCAQFLLYYVFARKTDKRNLFVFVASILSLILSGSRTNLLLTIIFIIIFIFKVNSGMSLSEGKKTAIKTLLVGLIMLIPFLSSMTNTLSIFDQVIERLEDSLQATTGRNNTYFEEDGSMIGRQLSFVAGYETFKENPLGLSTSTIDLQVETIKHGFHSFPHSTLFSFFFLWGVAALFCYFKILKYLFISIKKKHPIWVLLLYIAVSMVFYGSPIVNPKEYFWYLIIITYCVNVLRESDEYKIDNFIF